MHRRRFLSGLALTLAAPALVRASSLEATLIQPTETWVWYAWQRTPSSFVLTYRLIVELDQCR